MDVAPYAGAWIETGNGVITRYTLLSPPTRGRGLKPPVPGSLNVDDVVAPYAGAWIETA